MRGRGEAEVNCITRQTLMKYDSARDSVQYHDIAAFTLSDRPGFRNRPGVLLHWGLHRLGAYTTGAALPDNDDASNSLPLQMAECLFRAHPYSVVNHVTAHLISVNVCNTFYKYAKNKISASSVH